MRDETEILEGAAELDGLSEKQHKALAALVSEPTVKAAAEVSGVGESTIFRYLQDSTFTKRLRELRRDAVAFASARLQRDAGEAARVLNELMTGVEVPPAVRLGAARSVLENAYRSLEADDLQARVEDLERFIKSKTDAEAADELRDKEEEDEE